MITKKHIQKRLEELSSDVFCENSQMPAAMWQAIHEYMVNHYERLDKEARAYADDIFDQLEASMEQKIRFLPESREKKLLNRKLSTVQGKRPPVPVLYLDTPVIENVIRHRLGERLAKPVAAISKAVYEETVRLVRAGKLICPENSFYREALQTGGTQSRAALDIVRTLSEGLSFKHSQSIEDSQVFRALRGFINGSGPVDYREFWEDAFERNTVDIVTKRHPSVVFRSAYAIAEKPAPASRKDESDALFTRLKVRYDRTSVKNERQLQRESARHLRDLVRLGMRYLSIMEDSPKRRLDGFWAGQKVDLSLALWRQYGGNPESPDGLASFFESEHFSNVPAIRIKQDIWNRLSIDRTMGLQRATGHVDVNILSAVLSYTDIMILSPRMTDVIRDGLGFDVKFDAEIYSTDEHDLINAALKEIAWAD